MVGLSRAVTEDGRVVAVGAAEAEGNVRGELVTDLETGVDGQLAGAVFPVPEVERVGVVVADVGGEACVGHDVQRTFAAQVLGGRVACEGEARGAENGFGKEVSVHVTSVGVRMSG